MEILWGLVFSKVDGSRTVVDELLKNLSNILQSGPNDGSNNAIANDRADGLLDSWKNSGVPSAIELMLDGEFIDDQTQIGAAQAMDSPVRDTSLPGGEAAQSTPHQAPAPLPTQHRPPSPAAIEAPAASYPIENDFTTDRLTLPPLPPDWHALTQVYFTVDHSWFPLLERHALFRTAYLYADAADSKTTIEHRHRAEYATLWAVLALGEIHISGALSSRAIYYKAMSKHFLDSDCLVEGYYIYFSQALLAWSVIHLGSNKLVLARSALAQSLVFCSAIPSDPPSRQRTLILSGCFVMDALLSLTLDTRPLMSKDDLPSSAPCDETGSDEWEPYVDKFRSHEHSNPSHAVPSRVASTFNNLVHLSCILNAIMQKQTSESDLVASIESWSFSLPRHLTTSPSSTRPNLKNVLPPQLHLRAICSAIQFVIISRRHHSQPANQSINLPQDPMRDVAASMLDISRNFGVQAMPASFSVLLPLLLSSSASTDHDSTQTRHLIAQYKATWAWDSSPSHQDQDIMQVAQASQSGSHLPSNLPSQDPLHAAMYCEIPHGTFGSFDMQPQSMQSNALGLMADLSSSGQPDTNQMNLNTITTSMNNDAAVSAADSMLENTPEQLLDYLALLQENER